MGGCWRSESSTWPVCGVYYRGAFVIKTSVWGRKAQFVPSMQPRSDGDNAKVKKTACVLVHCGRAPARTF